MNKLHNRLIDILAEKSIKIVIVSHVNPDGDAIGSSLGLYQFLKNAGYDNTQVVIPNAPPSFLTWVPNNEVVIIATRKGDLAREAIKNADLIFCLDFNDLERTDQLSTWIRKADAKRVLIDHHPDPKDEFDFIISHVEKSSTSEIVYEFMQAMDGISYMDKSIAECLYTGIITDTGSFSYSCNDPQMYRVVAHLLELGVDGEGVHRNIYDTYSEDRMRLLGHCLSQRLVVSKKYHTAYIYLSDADLKNFNYRDGDTEGVVNYALSIHFIKLACIFIEKEKVIKISFRSKEDVNVNTLARKYFNGGGHKNAAGGNYKDSLENTLSFFNSILKDISEDNFKSLRELPDNT